MIDEAFLERMLAESAGNLCTHDKADLQRLVKAAGFGPNTLLWHDVAGEGTLEVRGEAIQMLVAELRGEDLA